MIGYNTTHNSSLKLEEVPVWYVNKWQQNCQIIKQLKLEKTEDEIELFW